MKCKLLHELPLSNKQSIDMQVALLLTR